MQFHGSYSPSVRRMEQRGVLDNWSKWKNVGYHTIFDGVDLPHCSLLLEVLVDLFAEQVVLVGDSIPGVAHPLRHLDQNLNNKYNLKLVNFVLFKNYV